MTISRIESSAAQLMAKARELTGIDSIDAVIEEPLRHFLDALNTEAQLNPVGAAGMEDRMLRVLCNRLRMQRDFEHHPEIDSQQIVRPLILTGGGRTGSTKLHKLLAASGDFLYLPFWQGYSLSLRTGDRDEDPARRIRDAEEHVHWFDTHAPGAKLIHPYETFEPEEETLLLEHLLCGIYMMAFVFVPGYAGWSMQFLREQLELVKRGLKYLQWQFHDGDPRPWVLKCPIHFGNEVLLKQVFPDALLVATHRNPLHTLSSTASLLEHYHQAYSDTRHKTDYGSMMFEGTAMAAQQHMDGRDAHPEMSFLDVGYPELTRNSERVLEKIYAHANMRFPEQARLALRAWEQKNAQHKYGLHKHSLEEYSLSAAQVSERFAAYTQRFKPYLD